MKVSWTRMKNYLQNCIYYVFLFLAVLSLKQNYNCLQLYCTIIYNYFKFVLIDSDGRVWHVNKAWEKYTDISLRPEAEDCRSEFIHAVTRADGRSSRPRLGLALEACRGVY